MGSRSSHLQFSFWLACFLLLLLSRLPSDVMYATIFVILFWVLSEMGNFGEDKAVDVWRKLKERIPEGSRPVVEISGLWAKIYSLRQGEETVEKYFEEFNVVWEKLETSRLLPACTCRAKCSCCKYLQEERKEREKLKVVRFLEGLDGDRFDATRSEIMLKGPLPSLDKVYNLVKEAAQTASAAKQKPDVKQAPEQAKTTPGKVDEVQKLNCPIHSHPLTLKPSGAPHECSGCLDLRLAPSYCCETDNCNYILHKECANIDNSPVPHRFFENGKFKFYKKNTDDCEKVCTACGNDVRGFFYYCGTTKQYLHPCCLKLKDSVSDEEGQTLKLLKSAPKKCKTCKHKKVNNIEGWAYVSPDKKNCFHVSCVNGLILNKWKKGHFSTGEMSLQRYDLTTRIPLTCKEMVKAGGSSKPSGKTKVFIKIATVALELIVSVVLGNPAPLLVSAIGAISSD